MSDEVNGVGLLIEIPEALAQADRPVVASDLIAVPVALSNDDDVSVQADCGSCQSSTQSCGSSESGSCSACEGLGCMSSNCQTACQSACQTTCEKKTQSCSTTCEKTCQTTCEKNCQDDCESACQDDCEYYEGDCNSCMVDAQDCGGAQGDCDSCQGTTQSCSQSCSESCTASSEGSTSVDPTWSITSITNESVTAKVSDKGDYSYFSWSLRDSSGSTVISGPTAYSTSTSKTFSGLSPNTTYRVYISWSTSTTGMGFYDWDSFTTANVDLEPWSWSENNGDAGDTLTVGAYVAITDGGSTSNFNYLVWNDLVNKVMDAKDVAGYSWNTKYLTLGDTLMSSSDKTMTAARFNSVRYNIGIHQSTGLDEVASGDPCKGAYFSVLTTALNKWISSLNS